MGAQTGQTGRRMPQRRPAAPEVEALRELARRHGVETRHLDGFDREVTPAPETLARIVSALGSGSGEAPDPDAVLANATELLRETEARRAAQLVEPVSVSWSGEPVVIRCGPALSPGSRVEVRIQSAGPNHEEVPTREVFAQVGPEGIPVPGRLPDGYHHVEVTLGSRSASGLLIVAPPRVFGALEDVERDAPDGTPSSHRAWGVFLPLNALRSVRDWGAGDLTDLGRLVRWTAERGGTAVGTLPLMSAFLDDPLEPSPYSPVSRLFWNEIYLDPTQLPEWHLSDEARRTAASDSFRQRVGELRNADEVDLRGVHQIQSRLLDSLAQAWIQSGGLDSPAFREYRTNCPDAGEYAAFRATLEAREESWPAWPDAWRRSGIPRDAYRLGDMHRHLYAQFRFPEQLAAAATTSHGQGAGLYLDLPLGAHPQGYDIWAHPGLFGDGMELGAPPDGFHEDGQGWGLPPIRPGTTRADGHHHIRQILARLLPHARYLRVDHVMGLHRRYWVPAGESPRRGAYVRYPHEELYAILSLESHRHRTILVGEDLGTVPPEVRDEMDRRGLRRMYVLPFEFSDEPQDPQEPDARPIPRGAVAALNTHDTAPFAALWSESEVQERLRGIGEAVDAARQPEHVPVDDADWPEALRVLRRILQWLGMGPAGLVLVNLEDLWLEERPQNRPGTAAPANWRRKATRTLEELTTDARVLRCLESLAAIRRGERPSQASPLTPSPPTNATERRSEGVSTDESTDPRASALSPDDVYLFNEGSHTRLYRKLGAHWQPHGDPPGTRFAVWAPNAREVSVVGDFNHWEPGAHPLEPREASGIWEGFIAGVEKGATYKYHIRAQQGGHQVEKADPFGFRHEHPPATASVVWDLEYEWGDSEWMEARRERNRGEAPISVYEVHLGSWRRDPDDPERMRGYRELARELADYVVEQGFTHVELLPIMEHPFYGSWGYQTTGYFAPTSRHGSPQDFMYLVDHLHQRDIGVILDWVPSHFPSDEHGLAYFDGTHLFEHADPRQGFHPDWESLIFNFGRNEVRSFLLSSALFWLDHYHVDGLRVDAVASMLYLDYSRKEGEWIPNRYGGRENLEAIDFIRRLNEEVYGSHPDVQTIAEESTAWPMVSRPTYLGGLGFGMKWDMGWMHDTLQYMGRDPVHRRHHHHELTFRGVYAFNENFMLPLSHDEVVHGKGSLLTRMPGSDWEKRANLRLLLASQFLQPGKKLLFMGCELGQRAEWNHDGTLEWELLNDPGHEGIQRLVRDLNHLYRREVALHRSDFRPEGFEWIELHDEDRSVLAFLRKDVAGPPGPPVAVVFNHTPIPRENYRIGVPSAGFWTEILNTDASEYGGSGVGNMGGVESAPTPAHGRYRSLVVTLPPLAAVAFRAPLPEESP